MNLRETPYDMEAHESPAAFNVRYPWPDTDEAISSRTGRYNIYNSHTAPGGVITDAAWSTPLQALFMSGKDGDIYKTLITQPVTQVQWNPTLSAMTKVFDSADTGEWLFVTPEVLNNVPYAMPRAGTGAGTAVPQKLPNTVASVTWPGTPPTSARDMVYWRGRVVICDPQSRIRYSDVGNPESPTTGSWGNNFIDIYDDHGSRNSCLVVHNNNLYLFKEGSVWMIFDPNSFANRLLCQPGAGGFRCAVSNPYDRRLYWFSARDYQIHSSNGETDHVIETDKVWPLLRAMVADGWELARMTVDPYSGSVMLAFSNDVSNSPPIQNTIVLEICCRMGKPGAHPCFQHNMNSVGFFQVPIVAPGTLVGNGMQETTGLMQTDVNFLDRYSLVFLPRDQSQSTAMYANDEASKSFSGTTAHVAIPSQWQSAWFSFQSEEPVERIRRLNLIYRGSPTIDIASSMVPNLAPTVATLTPTPLGLSSLDRSYLKLRGPNTKGRYHRLTVRNSVADVDWHVSALEFVTRGGKSKS